MKKLFFIILSGMFVIASCNNKSTDECGTCDGIFSETVTMYIDAEYGSCTDSVESKCNYVQFNDEIDENAWEIFENEICNFTFEPGYRYKLLVKRQKIGKDEDGNKIYKYCLMKIESMDRVFL